MTALRDLRVALAADLGAVGVPVYVNLPDAVTPPLIYITAPIGAAYVTNGDTFGSWLAAVDVVVLVPHGAADPSRDALDELIEAVLYHTGDWLLGGVDSPQPITVTEDGSDYLGTVVHLTKPFRLQ